MTAMKVFFFLIKQKTKTVARNVSLAARGAYAFLMGEGFWTARVYMPITLYREDFVRGVNTAYITCAYIYVTKILSLNQTLCLSPPNKQTGKRVT